MLIILIELVLHIILINNSKKSNWIILSKDQYFDYNKNKITNFIKSSYHPQLGWSYLNKLKINEKTNNGNITINFNNYGSRVCKTHFKKKEISLYGDSYAISRNVNDDESLQYFLSLRSKSNIQNYGVGGYGIDQTLDLLRINIKRDTSKKIVLVLVPETIARIKSYWGHYYSFKNYLSFKPIYHVKNNKLKYTKNFLNNKKNFYEINKKIKTIQDTDYFYKKKFLKLMFKFPYILNIFSILKLKILIKILMNLYKDSLNDYIRPMIMKNNYLFQKSLYKDNDTKKLMSLIIMEIKKICDLNKKQLYIFFAPQKFDIENNFYKNNDYNNFLKSLKRKNINIFNCLNLFRSGEDLDKFYVHQDHLGYHLNKKGNSFLANKIYKIIYQLDG